MPVSLRFKSELPTAGKVKDEFEQLVTALNAELDDLRILASGVAVSASGIRSVQFGTIAMNSAVLGTAALPSAVGLNDSILIPLGWSQVPALNFYDRTQFRLALTNSTTVTATRNTATADGAIVAFCVLYFEPGVIKTVFRSTIPSSAVAVNTLTIPVVAPSRTILVPLGFETNYPQVNTAGLNRQTLTDSVTVTATQGDSWLNIGGAGISGTIGVQVIEFSSAFSLA